MNAPATIRRDDPMGRIIARITAERRAEDALDRLFEAEAERMVSEPWRITRAVYTDGGWPVAGKSLDDVLADCRRKIEAEIGRGRAGHYTYDMSRLIALRQAEVALCRRAKMRTAA